ncbi:MAG: 50S ribosomal protein L10 [Propionibacteriaceae bacterium]
MARPDKVAAVAELKKKFSDSAGVVLTEYRGLTVAELQELRRSLGDSATYAVSKNTLTQIAAKEAGIEGLDDVLVGPTAIAFIEGDVVTVAKGLRDFGKANPHLVIKGGVLDGEFVDPDMVKKLADLESREVLLAKLAGGMQGALQGAVQLFAAPLSQAARVLGALEGAAAANPSLIGGAGTAQTEEPTQAQSNDDATEAAPAAEESTPTDAADAAEDN